MDSHKLAMVIQGMVGTRTYLPIDVSEAIIVFERKGYIHIIKGINSVFGSTSVVAVADKLLEYMNKHTYHNKLLEKLSVL